MAGHLSQFDSFNIKIAYEERGERDGERRVNERQRQRRRERVKERQGEAERANAGLSLTKPTKGSALIGRWAEKDRRTTIG